MEMEAITRNDEVATRPEGQLVDDIVALLRRTNTMEEKDALVHRYSGGVTTHIREMGAGEAVALRLWLIDLDERMNRMRRKVFALAHQVGWKEAGTNKADSARIRSWMLTYRGKEMQKMNVKELSDAITQFENVHKNVAKTFRR